MDSKKIGRRIREGRMKSHFTQQQFAEKLDISVNYLSAIERGVKTPKFETFINIANALHVSADELLMDVVIGAKELKISALSDKLNRLSDNDLQMVGNVIEALVQGLETRQ